jgi:hypothetical protein
MHLFISKETTLRRLFSLCLFSSAKKSPTNSQSMPYSLQYLTWNEVVMAGLYRIES